MVELSEIIKGYKDFELAFLIQYRAKGFTENSRDIIGKEIKRRNLTGEDLERLIREKSAIEIKNHNQMICPRCKSTRISSTREMIRNKYEASEAMDEREPRYEEKRYCNICYWDFSENKTKYDKRKIAKMIILVLGLYLLGSIILSMLLNLIKY